MGLWSGLSVIAVFEFIELAFDLVWYLTGRSKTHRFGCMIESLPEHERVCRDGS